MLNYFKKKFGKEKEQFFTPLRIALHSTISLNTVDILTLKDTINPLFVIPQGDLEVLAIGQMLMDDFTVYSIYTEDEKHEEFILQVVEGKDFRSGELMINELNLFKQVITIEPETEASLNRVLNDIGFLSIQVEGITYDRLWGDQFTEKMDFKVFHEKVVTPQETKQFVNNYILYGRDIVGLIGEKLQEMLLVGLEENDNKAQVMMQLGLKLDINTVSVQ